MKPLKTYQPGTQTAIQIVKRHRDTADYWVRYYYSKSLEESAGQWNVVCNILNRILEELEEDNDQI
jgi:hypothetical protein